MNNKAYFIYGSRIYHPTRTNHTIVNKTTTDDTYIEERKQNPYSLVFGQDYANSQNLSDSNERRKYFFPPSFTN